MRADAGIGRAPRGTILAVNAVLDVVWLLGLALERWWIFIEPADNAGMPRGNLTSSPAGAK